MVCRLKRGEGNRVNFEDFGSSTFEFFVFFYEFPCSSTFFKCFSMFYELLYNLSEVSMSCNESLRFFIVRFREFYVFFLCYFYVFLCHLYEFLCFLCWLTVYNFPSSLTPRNRFEIISFIFTRQKYPNRRERTNDIMSQSSKYWKKTHLWVIQFHDFWFLRSTNFALFVVTSKCSQHLTAYYWETICA